MMEQDGFRQSGGFFARPFPAGWLDCVLTVFAAGVLDPRQDPELGLVVPVFVPVTEFGFPSS
jgi:hypothetical protein